MSPSRRRLLVAGIPFAVSLILSLSTVGSHPFWQDSGFYLVALKEGSVLYPPGFVLYQTLCRAWTGLLFFVDFTLAVHLFSSLCAALAAGGLALAARELLGARGPLFAAGPSEDESLSDGAAAAAGCLAACGFTFWFTGIYAKGYSLYYLVLALLIRSLIRAAEGKSGREFTAVAVLIGLAWTCHPSSGLLGPVLVGFVLLHARGLGLKGLAGRIGASAAVALGPSLFLPLLARGTSLAAMGDPSDPRELVGYLFGTTFTTLPGAFGWEASRVASFGQYLWEEFLGVGLAVVTAGLLVLSKVNRRLLLAMLLWILPYAVGTILFKMEGQHDCWFVAGWMPLYLVAALGIRDLARRAGARRHAVPVAVAAAGLLWAAVLNAPLLNQRNYDLPETFGRLHLDALDPGAVVLLTGDDPIALTSYLQTVRGVRTDVVVVNIDRLGAANPSHGTWYQNRLLAAHPFLRAPVAGPRAGNPGSVAELNRWVTAFVAANADCGRPLFTSFAPSPELLREDLQVVPAGALWKVVRRGSAAVDPAYWKTPIEADDVRRRYRRERGQEIHYDAAGIHVTPEAYERRLFTLLKAARLNLAAAFLRQGNPGAALKIYEWVLDVEPGGRENPGLLFSLAHAYAGVGNRPRARECLESVLRLASDPVHLAGAQLLLGKLAREEGRVDEARERFRLALQVPGINARLRREIEEAARQP